MNALALPLGLYAALFCNPTTPDDLERCAPQFEYCQAALELIHRQERWCDAQEVLEPDMALYDHPRWRRLKLYEFELDRRRALWVELSDARFYDRVAAQTKDSETWTEVVGPDACGYCYSRTIPYRDHCRERILEALSRVRELVGEDRWRLGWAAMPMPIP